jgi:ParB family chromosome partitioning protein
LKLPPEIQVGIRDNKISMGHARAIITIDDVVTQLAIYHEIIDNELSVRQVEALARNNGKKESNKPAASSKPSLSPNIKQIQEKLCGLFETKIELKEEKEGKGKIVIPYYNTADFNRIIEMLGY